MRKDTALMIMAKQPTDGSTKTRLSPFLTSAEAARFYEALLRDTIALAALLSEVAELVIAITPPESIEYFNEISPPDALLLPVEGQHIGECLEKGLKWLFEEGYTKGLAFNSDGPSLPLAVLQQAIHSLDEVETVLGPSQDGGYYLIGMRRLYPELFQGISWSTGQVFIQTLERARQLGLKTFLTQLWYDIDTAEDLLFLRDEIALGKVEGLRYTRGFLEGLDLANRPL